jgi:hypothetical protein
MPAPKTLGAPEGPLDLRAPSPSSSPPDPPRGEHDSKHVCALWLARGAHARASFGFVRMLPERYAYRRCKDSNYDIIVRWDGFDAQETSCNLNKIDRQGAAWLANFGCSDAGLKWLEDDEIRVSKDGWTLETKIKKVRRVGDPVRYCLLSKC